MLASENFMGCLWIVVWWLIDLLQHILLSIVARRIGMHIHPQQDYCHLPIHSKIIPHCLPLVSLEVAHPSLLETGPSSPNRKKESVQLLYTADTIVGGDATIGPPTTLTRFMIWQTC
jgi:hypothetical protein